uniref:universal stress protein n=1 Tax=Streptomyces sp. SAT1 TaxID=1849967 RepID=UPI0007F987D3|nr:universal stress protein [Streptomyces sp. SAT1]ANO42541.1 universal stress protein [Streptomyces sp. SAT1]
MDLPLVVGVDGSEPALRAVDWAADEAVLRGLPLRVVYASLWERYEGAALARDLGKPDARVAAEDVVRAGAHRARARRPDLAVSLAALPEAPEYALLREARNASALVVGSRGRGGVSGLLLGSVGLYVAAHADCPVVVVRPGGDNQARTAVHGRVVVGIGDEPAAEVPFAAREAALRGAALEAVRAWRCPAPEPAGHPLLTGGPERGYGEAAEEAAAAAAEVLEEALRDVPPRVEVRRRTAEGPAHKVLLGASRTADLLVVGARRRPGRLGLQLGRVAHALLHHALCPVAVVPHRA